MTILNNEDRELIVRNLDQLLSREADPERRRRLWSDPVGRSTELWTSLSEMGIPGLFIGEPFGGSELSEVEMVTILEVFGRHGIHEAFIESCVASGFIEDAMEDSIKTYWLPGIADGSKRIGLKLDSSKYVRDAHVVDGILWQEGSAVNIIERENYDLQRMQTQDPAERLFLVTNHGNMTNSYPWNGIAKERVQLRLDVGISALLIGISEYLLNATVDYAMVREQFNRPIGSFQALKHLLSDAYARFWIARQAVVKASKEIALGTLDALYSTRAARIVATEASAVVSDIALQCHGGIGFTWEHDLHGYLKAQKSLEVAYGGIANLARENGVQMVRNR